MAATFSSRCATEEVPSICSITGERARSQARAICASVYTRAQDSVSSLPVVGGATRGGAPRPHLERFRVARGYSCPGGGMSGWINPATRQEMAEDLGVEPLVLERD